MKELKHTNVIFEEIDTEEVKKILPDCNIEIKECHFDGLESDDSFFDESDSEWTTNDSSDSDDV